VLLDIDSYPDEVVPLIKILLTVSDAKILLITRLDDLTLQDNAIIAGARGLIDRNVTPELLLTAIETVHE
jgi:DNA-binding NarL/FixJ family response regulator